MKLRAYSFLALFAVQAVAGGVLGVVHLCSATKAMERCACPHGKKADDPHSWRAIDCCDTQALRAVAPATPDSVRLDVPLVPQPALAPAWMVPQLDDAEARPAFAWNVAPPGQGPPIYLKVQSLLN